MTHNLITVLGGLKKKLAQITPIISPGVDPDQNSQSTIP
jgi:hypothetical protein